MPVHYVEDYEELTGKKPDPAPGAGVVETKVVSAPENPAPESGSVAEVK